MEILFAKKHAFAAFLHIIHLIFSCRGLCLALRHIAPALKASKAKQSHALPKYPVRSNNPAGSAFRGLSHPPQPSAELAFAANLTRSTSARHRPTRGSHPQGKGCAKGLTTPSAESNGEEDSKIHHCRRAVGPSDCSLLPAVHGTAARQRFPCVWMWCFVCLSPSCCFTLGTVAWSWCGFDLRKKCTHREVMDQRQTRAFTQADNAVVLAQENIPGRPLQRF